MSAGAGRSPAVAGGGMGGGAAARPAGGGARQARPAAGGGGALGLALVRVEPGRVWQPAPGLLPAN